MHLASVVFPEPDSPTTATQVSASTSRLISERTGVDPYDAERPRTERAPAVFVRVVGVGRRCWMGFRKSRSISAARTQRTTRPLTVIAGGSSTRHAATANEQRGAKGQPAGRR